MRLTRLGTAIIVLAVVLLPAKGEQPRLLLVPTETSVKPGSKATLDLYVWNSSPRPVSVPSLDFISTIISSKRTGAVEIAGKTSTSAPAEHSLPPNRLTTGDKPRARAKESSQVFQYVEEVIQKVTQIGTK
jgi:hypothetical protein